MNFCFNRVTFWLWVPYSHQNTVITPFETEQVFYPKTSVTIKLFSDYILGIHLSSSSNKITVIKYIYSLGIERLKTTDIHRFYVAQLYIFYIIQSNINSVLYRNKSKCNIEAQTKQHWSCLNTILMYSCHSGYGI